MPTFECSIVVRAPRGWLFELMQDYDRRLDWDSFLSEARLVDASQSGVGVRAWCVDRSGRGMETEYVTYRPPDRVAVRMTRGPWVFRAFAGSWKYRELARGETRVTFRYHVEARIRVFGLGDRFLVWLLSRQMTRRLDAMRDRLDSLWARTQVNADAGMTTCGGADPSPEPPQLG